MDIMKIKNLNKKIALTLITLILVSGATYGSYRIYSNFQNLQNEFEQAKITSDEIVLNLQESITKLVEENENLNNILTEEQKKIINLEKIKQRDAKKIDTLEKLTTIDPELLRKYSKVFFLSENYTPPKLEDIPVEFKIQETKDLKVLKDVEPYLTKMLEEAHEAGVDLKVISAYRSFDEQKALKSNYTVTYGSGANQFSADQGYSEHQLGTTIDFGTTKVTGAYMSFENTPAFEWLQEHAHKYGFVLSYPKGNQYYQYEPWHWRFVGEDLAEDLYKDKKNFYELDQREIDEYLIEIFD
jgi:LAS superfamily LD-carboxypeptidase LdcB